MDTAILRSRILDLAIRGQLVPQDPNEGTADDLLKTIATQRGKAITPITDNVPFDIPANWRWVKLGDIIQHNTGKTLNERKNIGTIKRKYITTSNVYWSGIDLSSVKETLFTEQEIEKYSAIKGDLLVCEGGDVGRAAIWDKDEEICFQNHLHRLRTYVPMNIKYFFYIFYNFKLQGRIKGKGIGIDGLSSGVVDKLSLPLPPLAEQHRIVAKVEELLSEVDKIEQAQADITQAATILRSRVLDSALKGELTHSNTEEWTWDSITNVTDPISSRDSQIKASKIQSTGKYAVVSQGQKLIDGYCDDEDKVITISPVILFGDHTRNVKYIDFPFVVGADGTKLHKCKSISPKFCYYWMLWAADNMTNRGYERHYSLLKQTPLHLPPLPEQHRIVAKIEQLFTEIDKLV